MSLRLSLFPQTVPKTLGSVSITLWNPFRGGPFPPAAPTIISQAA